MLTLSLLRHAKSSWDEPGLSDHERPLAKRGQKAAPKVGAALAGMGVQPDLVLCSSAARTRETLSLVLQKFPAPPPQVVYEESIYMATPAALLMRIRSVEAEHCDRTPHQVMVVGHNPGLEELAMLLIGRGPDDDMRRIADKFPTCAAAIIAFETNNWTEIDAGAGRLEHFIMPRQLP
jgi:phosphohistidine phosphatase